MKKRESGMPDTGVEHLAIEERKASVCHIPADQGREILLSLMDRVNDISGASDTLSVVQGILDLMIEVTQADSANFFQLDSETDEFVCKSVRGDVESQYLIGLRLNRQLFLPGLSIRGTQPAVIGDLPSDPYWLRTIDPASAVHKRNVINLPITDKHTTLGVVQIFNYQRAELDLLSLLGNRLAHEVNHRIEVDNAQQSNQRLIRLIDVLGEIAGTLDRNRLLHLVTENASRLVDAERSSIFLVDPETKEMVFQVAYSAADQDPAPPSTRRYDRKDAPTLSKALLNNKQVGPSSPNQEHDREFRYFNRAAITVPLSTDPLKQDQSPNRGQVLGGLMAHNKQNACFHEEDAQVMQILANQASAFLQVVEMYESAGDLFLGVIKALVAAIDAKDPYTQGHSHRVSDYSVLIAQELGLDETLVNDIRIGSLLHDIGKIGIPDHILLKKGKITEDEFEVIKRHPTTGINILSQVKLLESSLPAIAEHHERLDGSGYPSKLAGQQITLMGRIVAVADVFDAMTSDRPYRHALSIPEVLAHLQENAGLLFEKSCVQALVKIIERSNEEN